MLLILMFAIRKLFLSLLILIYDEHIWILDIIHWRLNRSKLINRIMLKIKFILFLLKINVLLISMIQIQLLLSLVYFLLKLNIFIHLILKCCIIFKRIEFIVIIQIISIYIVSEVYFIYVQVLSLYWDLMNFFLQILIFK